MTAGNDLEIPIFSYEDIRPHADTFLKQYHPSREIPIPIEEIIVGQWKHPFIFISLMIYMKVSTIRFCNIWICMEYRQCSVW
jgi:hypothetical protein